MKITSESNLSRICLCLGAAAEFGLSDEEALVIVETQIRGIVEHFDQLCEEVEMTQSMRERLRRRAVLNPDIFAGCEDLNPKDW